MYLHKSFFSNNFQGAISDYKGVLHCEGYDYEEFPDGIMEDPLSETSFIRRLKMLSRRDGFKFNGKLGFDRLCTCELLYPKLRIRLRLIRARPNFYMISDNHDISLGSVNCSLETCRMALKGDYHRKRMDLLALTCVEFNYLDTLARIFIIPARQNRFIREKVFNNAPICWIATGSNTNSPFTGSYNGNPFWYQNFDLRQIIIARGGQKSVVFHAADNWRQYVLTMEAMNFHNDFRSIPSDN